MADARPPSLRERAAIAWKALSGGVTDVAPGSPGYALLTGIQPAAVGFQPARGVRELLEAYSDMPWLRACASRVGDAVAAVQWQLFVTQKKTTQAKAYRHRLLQRAPWGTRRQILKQLLDKEEAKEISDHPLLDLLDRANSYHTGQQVRKLTQVHLDLAGETLWLMSRNAQGMPVEIWPIPPSWVQGTPTPTFPFFRVSYRAWQERIPSTEILWIVDADPSNPYARGSGLAKTLADELESDEYAAKHTRQFFLNRARPDFLIMGTGLNEPETRKLEQDWLNKRQGLFRQWLPHFLSKEVKVHEFDQDLRSLQFVQLREFEMNAIMRTWGMPPEIMGVLTNSNRATIDAADYLFASKVVVPRLEFLRAHLQERLIPLFDERLVLDYVSPVQEDREFKLKAMGQASWAYRVDEHREVADYPPLDKDEGCVFMVPALVSPMTTLEPKPEPVPLLPSTVPGSTPPGNPPPTPKPQETPAGEVVPPTPPAPPKRLPKHPERKGYEDAMRRISDRLEPTMRKAFLKAVGTVRDGVSLDALARAIERGDVVAALNALHLADLASELSVGLPPVLEAAFSAGGVAAADLAAAEGLGAGLSLDLTNPRAVAWLATYGAQLVTGVSTETQQGIREILGTAFSEGRHPYDVARSLRTLVGLTERQMQSVESLRATLLAQELPGDTIARRTERYAEAQTRARADTIARTEVLAASNHGQQELWQQGVDAGHLDPGEVRRMWIVTDDDRLDREVCEPMDEQQRSMSEPFRTGQGKLVMVPPAHPNCRCTVGLVRAKTPKSETATVMAALAAQQDRGMRELTERVLTTVTTALAAPRERVLERDAAGRAVRVIDRPTNGHATPGGT